jgi:hypothetical protein
MLHSGIIRLYDASWNVLQEANVGDMVPKLKNGNNRLIDSDFSGNGNASIHVELKTSVKIESAPRGDFHPGVSPQRARRYGRGIGKGSGFVKRFKSLIPPLLCG